MSKLIAIGDEGASGHVQRCSLHLIEQIGPHDFRNAAHDFVFAFIDDFRFVNGDTRLFTDAVLKLILGPVF